MNDDLKRALENLGMSPEISEIYVSLLFEHGFENEKICRSITLEDLKQIGIQKLGHAKVILFALRKLQRIRVQKRHVFYISHDKVDAGTEASMFVDAASLRYADKFPFIDSHHKHLKTPQDFMTAMLASSFCVILLTPRYIRNPQCLCELTWAQATGTPICVVKIDRLGLEKVETSFTLETVHQLLSSSDWERLERLEISPKDVFENLNLTLSENQTSLVFQPHESREIRQSFFTLLWRYAAEISINEAINSGVGVSSSDQVFALDQQVDVRWRRGVRWYTGKVADVASNGTYTIQYDDGDRETGVTPDCIQRHCRPPIIQFQQDEKVEARWKKRNVFFPGRVVAVHEAMDLYDIVYDDGDIEIRVSYELMRKV